MSLEEKDLTKFNDFDWTSDEMLNDTDVKRQEPSEESPPILKPPSKLPSSRKRSATVFENAPPQNIVKDALDSAKDPDTAKDSPESSSEPINHSTPPSGKLSNTEDWGVAKAMGSSRFVARDSAEFQNLRLYYQRLEGYFSTFNTTPDSYEKAITLHLQLQRAAQVYTDKSSGTRLTPTGRLRKAAAQTILARTTDNLSILNACPVAAVLDGTWVAILIGKAINVPSGTAETTLLKHEKDMEKRKENGGRFQTLISSAKDISPESVEFYNKKYGKENEPLTDSQLMIKALDSQARRVITGFISGVVSAKEHYIEAFQRIRAGRAAKADIMRLKFLSETLDYAELARSRFYNESYIAEHILEKPNLAGLAPDSEEYKKEIARVNKSNTKLGEDLGFYKQVALTDPIKGLLSVLAPALGVSNTINTGVRSGTKDETGSDYKGVDIDSGLFHAALNAMIKLGESQCQKDEGGSGKKPFNERAKARPTDLLKHANQLNNDEIDWLMQDLQTHQSNVEAKEVAQETETESVKALQDLEKIAPEIEYHGNKIRVRNILKDYTAGSENLRKYAVNPNDTSVQSSQHLQALLDETLTKLHKQTSGSPRITYRYVGYNDEKEMPFGKTIQVGDVVADPGYLSTSAHKQFIMGKTFQQKRHIVNMSLIGRSGVPIADDQESTQYSTASYGQLAKSEGTAGLAGQAEVLYPRNTKFKVLSIQTGSSSDDGGSLTRVVLSELIDGEDSGSVKDIFSGETSEQKEQKRLAQKLEQAEFLKKIQQEQQTQANQPPEQSSKSSKKLPKPKKQKKNKWDDIEIGRPM